MIPGNSGASGSIAGRARRVVTGTVLVVLLTTAACTSESTSEGGSTATATPTTTSTSLATSAAPTAPGGTSAPVSLPAALDPATRAWSQLDEAGRVGQLFMVGSSSTAADPATLKLISSAHIGSVILDGNSSAGAAATQVVSTALQTAAGSPRLFVATDQEGGQVQRLRGPGFSTIPSALQQGALAPATLTADASQWATELKSAGVNLNLGPVVDTVPGRAIAAVNPPIGALDREFSYDPASVSAHGVAVLTGYANAGIAATAKHFPGLGRVSGNTDTTAGVTDHVTTATDAYIAPFQAAVAAGAPFVMMSTAIYAQIDAGGPAAFSASIVSGLLRGQLKFGGVVISDDLGAAQQVAAIPAGTRAVDFIAAGGDLVLSVDAAVAAKMVPAVLARAGTDTAFRAQVDAAALRVLQAKQKFGLL